MPSDDESEDIFLICDQCGRTQTIVGDIIPGPVVLNSIRKQVEQAMINKQSTPPWIVS